MNELAEAPEVRRGRIMAVQRACQGLPDGQRMDESPPMRHVFAPGVYCREIHLKADTVVVGRVHRHEHANIISQGRVTVYTEFAHETITAPASFVSAAGTKRVVWCHEDTIWTTIHPNPDNVRDTAQLEEIFTAADYAELGMAVQEDQECLTG